LCLDNAFVLIEGHPHPSTPLSFSANLLAVLSSDRWQCQLRFNPGHPPFAKPFNQKEMFSTNSTEFNYDVALVRDQEADASDPCAPTIFRPIRSEHRLAFLSPKGNPKTHPCVNQKRKDGAPARMGHPASIFQRHE